MRSYTTNAHMKFAVRDHRFHRDDHAEMNLLLCDTKRLGRAVIGFGAAFTESAAATFGLMPPELQDEVLRLCFTVNDAHPEAGGNGYNLCRTHIQSCDFTLGSYAYVRDGDEALESFSIERDRDLLLPFIRCGLATNARLELIAVPWSPPSFMKTNGSMSNGGSLLERYYGSWARILATYLSAYEAEGVSIGRLSVQNEPNTSQFWESCVFSPEMEARFASKYLKPVLDDAGFGDVKLFMWDHNKDLLTERVNEILGALEAIPADNPFSGIAFHWYAGDHFEQVELVAREHPNLELLSTEGCVDYFLNAFVGGFQTREKSQRLHAERYAHDMLGNLRAGAQGFIDWNLLLNEKGGPNHAHNYCEAPLQYNRKTGELVVNRSFYYLGQVSRFVKPGARLFATSRCDNRLSCAGFINPTGERVLVLLNETDHDITVRVAERPYVSDVTTPGHGIVTLRWSADELFD